MNELKRGVVTACCSQANSLLLCPLHNRKKSTAYNFEFCTQKNTHDRIYNFFKEIYKRGILQGKRDKY